MRLPGKGLRLADKVIIHDLDETYIRITADKGIEFELAEAFTFLADNYKFNPKYKAKLWNGKIRMYKINTKTILKGMLHRVIEFCNDRGYEVVLDGDFATTKFTTQDALDFIKTLNLPDHITVRDYQVATFVHCIQSQRCLFVSPTSSGKSLMLYLIYRYLGVKSLLIVPRISLIAQMQADFKEYGYQDEVHKIFAGQDKNSDADISFSTWQSVFEQPEEYFDQFGLIIGDEAHNFKAKSLISIMERANKTKYKFGFTGTLDESSNNLMTLEGLFGKKEQFITSSEMIDQGYASKIMINIITLSYADELKKKFHDAINKLRSSKVESDKLKVYPAEVKLLINHEGRNSFIKDLALSLKGNGIILFFRVGEHGMVLHDMIKNSTDKPCYLIHGGIGIDEREQIRKIVNTHDTSITTASMGCFSEGINIPNLNWIILAHPSKSKIKVLQMIGRGLRKSDTKDTFTLYDIADDLSSSRGGQNTTLKHLGERIRFYIQEKFPYKLFKFKLK